MQSDDDTNEAQGVSLPGPHDDGVERKSRSIFLHEKGTDRTRDKVGARPVSIIHDYTMGVATNSLSTSFFCPKSVIVVRRDEEAGPRDNSIGVKGHFAVKY